MKIQNAIQQKLATLEPLHLEVVNESPMHNVPAGAESHFKVTIVSAQFDNKTLVARHRLVNQLLATELEARVHALSLQTKTPDEWFEAGAQTLQSPPCLGGSAARGLVTPS